MSAMIKVDEERLDEQMSTLSDALNNVPNFDDSMEFSSMGNMVSQSKYVELAEKMKKLMTSYKQLMENSALKAYSAAQGYKNTDQIMSEHIMSAYTEMSNGLQLGEK